MVQWKAGADKGKFSEVSTDAVRNYNDEDFDEDGNPIEEGQTEAIVEWRQGKKQKHGWPLHAGAVLFVHNNRFAIAKKMQECVEKKDLGKRLKRPLKTPKRYESSSDGSDTEPVKKTSSETSMAKQCLQKYKSGSTAETRDVEVDHLKSVQLQKENQDLKEENHNLKEMLFKEMPMFLTEIKEILHRSMNNIRRSSTPEVDPPTTPKSGHSMKTGTPTQVLDKVEIYPGTGVFCDKLVWALANNSHTATSFVRTLLVNLFPLDVLLKSNLRGRSKDTTEHRPALDATKIDAIYRATLQKWPNTPQAVIGSAINGKLAELRNKSKQKLQHTWTQSEGDVSTE